MSWILYERGYKQLSMSKKNTGRVSPCPFASAGEVEFPIGTDEGCSNGDGDSDGGCGDAEDVRDLDSCVMMLMEMWVRNTWPLCQVLRSWLSKHSKKILYHATHKIL